MGFCQEDEEERDGSDDACTVGKDETGEEIATCEECCLFEERD
jgi:hypothetical protein